MPTRSSRPEVGSGTEAKDFVVPLDIILAAVSVEMLVC